MRALAIVALCTTAASADPAGEAGPQPAPALPAPVVQLDQQPDGRRHIRGCAIGESCDRELLREFELEAFPPPGASPWLDERRPPPSRPETAAPRKVRKPSELRPDLPWLDKLALPDLPVTWSPRLIEYLQFYKNDPRGRSIIASWLVAQGRYRELIVSHLRKAKLPEDLLYVAMIESSYNPETLSSAGALGLWQFMPEGARIYGLRRDRWVDERKDPLRSTIAVLDYWHDLHQRFGDWELAMAAFNVGYGAMLRSIARYNTNDYYQLCELENGLPWETCLYTPKALAVAIVGKNRAAFGFDKLEPRPAEAWEEVAVPASLPTGVIARATGVAEPDIKRLNPHLRQGRTPPGEIGYVVRVPRGSAADFPRRLAELQSDWDGYDAYVVSHGERFEDIATTFGVTTAQLRKLNGVDRESEIGGGTVLVVPRVSEDERAKNRAKAKAKLLGSGIDHQEGESLIVPVPDKDATVPGKRRVFYRVVAGDTVGGVARALGVKPGELATWNAIDGVAKLHPRMVLLAWVEPSFDAAARKVALLDEVELEIVTRGSPEHLDLAEARTGRVRTAYVAKGGEALADVAKKYGMKAADLARINRISARTVLDKQQTIVVYQVLDPKRSARAEEQWKQTARARRATTSQRSTAAAKDAGKPAAKPAAKPAGKPAGKPARRKDAR
jgi:membrane-bound lytic murein transglycosylase D